MSNCLNISSTINLINTSIDNGCGGKDINLSSKLSEDVLDIKTFNNFTELISSEFIDVKNRQTISAYPTLRLIYDRYLSPTNCYNKSNGFNYNSMDLLTQSIGTYWVDIIEQFVPSTTLWGSTFVYRNTIFDTPKYKYKSNNIWLCEDPSDIFPFSAISNSCEVDVVKIPLKPDVISTGETTPFDTIDFFSCPTFEECKCVWSMKKSCYSEFLGEIKEIDNNNITHCVDDGIIYSNDIIITQSKAPNCNVANETWDVSSRIYTQIVKVVNTSYIPITNEFEYSITSYGLNIFNITFEITKLDTNTLKIEWFIPISAPDPEPTNCLGYFTNQVEDNTQLFGYSDIWDVKPIINIKTNEGCDISSVFITKGVFIDLIRPVIADVFNPINVIERQINNNKTS